MRPQTGRYFVILGQKLVTTKLTEHTNTHTHAHQKALCFYLYYVGVSFQKRRDMVYKGYMS